MSIEIQKRTRRKFDPKEIRTGRHCVFNIHAHLVFVTKYRRKIFTQEMLESMQGVFRKISHDFETQIEEFNGEEDHVHLLVSYPPKTTIAKLVNSLKGVSSRKLKQLHPEIEKHYWNGGLWSPSYFAGSCGGAPLSIVKNYIKQQQTPK